jgi:hypothetical protein
MPVPMIVVQPVAGQSIWHFEVWLDGDLRCLGGRPTEADARRAAETTAARLTPRSQELIRDDENHRVG